jgi:cold shock protein
MVQGTVKWFNREQGFGVIEAEGGDVFVHSTAVMADSYRCLAEGQRVEFDVVQGPKRLQAQNVRESTDVGGAQAR